MMNEIHQLQSNKTIIVEQNNYMIHFKKSRDIYPNIYVFYKIMAEFLIFQVGRG